MVIMAMLAPPIPRMKPMLTQQQPAPDMAQQPQQPAAPFVWGSGGERLSPADVAKKRQIAQAMMQEGTSYAPVQHWTQGLARVAQALAGGLEERRANEAETEGRAHFKDQLAQLLAAQGAPGADMNALRPQAAAAYSDPYADEGSKMMLAPQFTQPPQTDDMREYEWAKANGYQGSPMQYMQSLKTPAFNPGPGYAIAPDSTPDHLKVYRPDGMPPDPNGGGKPLNSAIMNDIKELGSTLQGTHEFVNTFNDTYGGKGENIIGGETANWLQSDIPGIASKITGLTGIETGTPEAADWWRRYQEYKNTVRHGKFGGALTPNEQAQFDKESITPNMTPESIRMALANQSRIIRGAVDRQRGMLLNSGYSQQAVDAGLGLDEAGAPDQRYQPAAQPGTAPLVRTQSEFDALPSGATYTEDDGKTYRKP